MLRIAHICLQPIFARPHLLFPIHLLLHLRNNVHLITRRGKMVRFLLNRQLAHISQIPPEYSLVFNLWLVVQVRRMKVSFRICVVAFGGEVDLFELRAIG